MIEKEDYSETRCPFCKPNERKRIPLPRVYEKFDNFMINKDFASAESLLFYWIKEANYNGDTTGELSLYNELTGLYRKAGEKDKCYSACEKCLEISSDEEIKGKIIEGTTYLNIATSKEAFGEGEKAVEYYDKAQAIYEKLLDEGDFRVCGLYNNKAVALTDLREFKKAEELFFKAIRLLQKTGGQETEIAVTYCNLIDALYSETGDKENVKIKEYLVKAKDCFNGVVVKHDFNYAYACEKCAGTFGFFGDVDFQNELKKRASDIYERA